MDSPLPYPGLLSGEIKLASIYSAPGIANDVLKMRVKKSLPTECETSISFFYSALSRLTLNLVSPRQEGTVFLFRETDHSMSKGAQIVTKWPYSYQITLL